MRATREFYEIRQTRDFYELENEDDPRLVPAADGFVRLRHRDLGRQRAAFRPWPTWRRSALVLLIDATVAVPAWVLPARVTAFALLVTVLVSALYLAGCLLGALTCKVRVCDGGLVLGWRRGRLLVPWETVDPGRVHVVENLLAAGRHPDFSALLPTQQGGFADRGLALCGLNSGTWNPPFAYWLVGTRHPEKLALEIEKAMCAHGLAARGLAVNASRTAVRARRAVGRRGVPLLPPVRGPFDPVLGVPRVCG